MKLKYAFENIDMGEEIVAVPVGKNAEQLQGVLKLNREGWEIVELLKDDVTEQEIIDLLTSKYDTRPELLMEYVRKVIGVLQAEGLVE